jgi:hypothetical protein
MPWTHGIAAGAVCLLVSFASVAAAATKTWTGSVDGLWSVAGNWAGGVPVASDRLSFFNAPGTHTTTNDLAAGTIFDDITFLDAPYSLAGNGVGLLTGIDNFSGSTNTITLPVTLHATQSFTGRLALADVAIGVHTLTLGSGGPDFITVSGNVSGSGGLAISSFVTMSGSSSFSGSTSIANFSTLSLNGASLASSPVLITAGTLNGSGSIGSLTTTPSPFANVAPGGILTTGPVQLGSQTQYFVSLTGPSAGSGYGQLAVTGGVTLAANVNLGVNLAYTPTVGQTYTLIDNDGVDAIAGTFNGLPEGSTLTSNASQFTISYVGGTGNDVVLTCTVAAKTWSGAVDALWSVPGNWGGVLPVSGDPLVFPPGAANLSNTNDLAAGIIYSQILMTDSGYTLSGNGIGLTGGINNQSGSPNTISLPLALQATQSFVGRLNLGAIALGVHTLTLGGGGPDFITVNGPVTGTGGIAVNGSVTMSGSNSYSGQTLVQNFTNLNLNGSIAASPVLITAGTLNGSGSIGSLTTTPSPFANVAPSGILTTGPVQLGSQTQYFVSLTGPSAGSGYGQLAVTGGVTLAANVNLGVNLAYTPTVGQTYTLIDNDGVDAIAGTFNGLPEGSTLTLNASQFQLSYVGGTGNDVVLTCTAAAKTWSGAVDQFWSVAGNWGGFLPASGDPLVFPSGAANLSNTNDLAAGTVYSQILMTGSGYTLAGNGLGLTGGINNQSGSPNTISLPLALQATQSFVGRLNLSAIALGVHTLTLGGGGPDFITVNGPVTGTGGITVNGFLTLLGSNSYSGQTLIGNFTNVNLNGSIAASPVLVTAGTLNGSGVVGSITTAPAPFANVALGGLLGSGPVQLGSGTNFSTGLNGPTPGSSYGQLAVTGGVTLASSVNLNVGLGFVPAQNQVFLIVDNDGTDAVSGTFNGLPEGGTFNVGPYPFQISYVGETGNDVILTSLSGDPLNAAPIAQDDSYNATQDTPLNQGAPGVLLNDSDPDLDSLSVVTTTVSTTAGGSVTFSPNGAFIYTPPTGYVGSDSCTYVVSDGNNGTDIATVTFTVAPAPTATITMTPSVTATATATPTATPTDTPDPSVCAATPASGCLAPGKALLLLKDKNPVGPSAGDKLVWKWLKGPALIQNNFGDPVAGSTGFRLCLYDSTGLVSQLNVAAGGLCGGNPCWKALGTKGYKFKDAALASDGLLTIILKGGAAGKSKAIVKAKDGNLPVPGLALDASTAVTVQLLRNDAASPCWEGVYPGPAVVNSTTKYKDKVP